MQVFLWRHIGGDWQDPHIWHVADWGGPAERDVVSNVQEATRAPTAGDTVLISNSPAPPSALRPEYSLGPITGGGEAAALYTMRDWGVISLLGDDTPGSEVYQFGSVALFDRILHIGEGAVLKAGAIKIDPTSRLSLGSAGTVTDSRGRTYAAEVGVLELEAVPAPPEYAAYPPGGQLSLGDNNILVHRIMGTGNVEAKGGTIIMESPPAGGLPSPPPPVDHGTDWNAVAARVLAAYEATGQWFDPMAQPPSPVTPQPDEKLDWDALAARVMANFEATGSWHL